MGAAHKLQCLIQLVDLRLGAMCMTALPLCRGWSSERCAGSAVMVLQPRTISVVRNLIVGRGRIKG